mmetsp:Transcript_17739/g.24964  ORF Transcript_17739/g.24964 Transcript_17739/m.24964 type:complete len:397 (-) Transcript_17739:38-1228(-)
MALLSLLLAFFITIVRIQAISDESANGANDEGFARLVNWTTKHGGRIDPRIKVGMSNGIRGMVAMDDIEVGAQLLFCPWKLIIGSSDMNNQMKSEADMCKVVQDMADEIRLGADSLWYPYLNHIELPRLPAMWSQAAVDELQNVPPSQDAMRHIRWFQQTCDGPLDDGAMKALVAFISRANEVGMTPIYDLLNHHNGKRNAKLSIVEDGVQLLVVGGPIRKGEQLYLSYGIKTASTMYRDYGFVEDWPSIWNYRSKTGDNFAFVLFPDGVAAINPTSELLKSIWHSNMPLGEYQILAETHMKTLALADLERFVISARDHLDGFPTTLKDDDTMLEEKKKALANQNLAESSIARSNIEDTMSAIKYRSDFKRALISAVLHADAMGSALREQTSSEEL